MVPAVPHNQRLDNALFLDGVRQFTQCFIRESLARLDVRNGGREAGAVSDRGAELSSWESINSQFRHTLIFVLLDQDADDFHE